MIYWFIDLLILPGNSKRLVNSAAFEAQLFKVIDVLSIIITGMKSVITDQS